MKKVDEKYSSRDISFFVVVFSFFLSVVFGVLFFKNSFSSFVHLSFFVLCFVFLFSLLIFHVLMITRAIEREKYVWAVLLLVLSFISVIISIIFYFMDKSDKKTKVTESGFRWSFLFFRVAIVGIALIIVIAAITVSLSL